MPMRQIAALIVAAGFLGCTDMVGENGWTPDREGEAIQECRRLVSPQADTCFTAAFCQCAVPDYRRRGDSYSALRGKLNAVAHFGRRGASGYYCTDTAESRCPADR